MWGSYWGPHWSSYVGSMYVGLTRDQIQPLENPKKPSECYGCVEAAVLEPVPFGAVLDPW